jgi:Fic family protein
MREPTSAILAENPQRIEPALLDDALPAAVADAVAELSAAAATLGSMLHPRSAASLADLVRIMNAYYSNLIEGHNTRPRDIARALAGDFDQDEGRRNLQAEAASHVRVQEFLDRRAAEGIRSEPASTAFIADLHRAFYDSVPAAMLQIKNGEHTYAMAPGEWRSEDVHEVVVGRHQPPASRYVRDFMDYFAWRYRFEPLGKAARIVALAAAHHRLNYIHPFPDGNGRVSRLMSHAMAHEAGIAAHGLWSISRGLARGLGDRSEYKRMMDFADTPRESDLDGRGNLSRRALTEFILWFLRVCLDQVTFMSGLFDLNQLTRRLRSYAENNELLEPGAARLLEEAAVRGEFERGDAATILGKPERSARRVLKSVVDAGLLASDTLKGPVSLRFTIESAEDLFPRLFGGG